MNWKYYKRWNDIEEILVAFRRWKREDTEKNMKRIKAACITQTIHFINKDITKSEYSKRKVQEEITRYKHRLDRERTKYKILSEEVEEDGSVIMEIVKEYGYNKPVGTYLD